MKQFILHTLKTVILFMVLLYVCDVAYTSIYLKSNPRNKLQYILNTKNENFDIVFLGSSRVANHIDTKLFDSLSNKKTINLGVQGAGLNDNLLQLRLLIESNNVYNVFLQLDDNFERTGPTALGTAAAMPFIRNNVIKEHTKEYFENFNALYYIPFYRYAINDPKIGFREVFFSLMGKKPRIDPSVGYNPKFGNDLSQKGKLPKTISRVNSILDEIRRICKEGNINLILFVSPYSSATGNMDYIEKLKYKIPELIDLSKGYDDELFFNYGHLNNKGGQLFTKRLYYSTLKKI